MNKAKMADLIIDQSFWMIRKTLGFLIKLIWVKKVTGLHNFPKVGPVVIAFNHQSYFDFLCFLAVAPRNVHFLAAEKFFTSNLWRPLMKITGQIPVSRTSHDKTVVHNTVHEHLMIGKAIGIFPEGTRSPHKEEMLFAFPGVAKYAIKAKVPVIPVGIKGAFEVMSRHDKRPRFTKIVEIHIGEPIHFTHYHDIELNQETYQELTHQIMLKVSGLCGKKYVHTGTVRTHSLSKR